MQTDQFNTRTHRGNSPEDLVKAIREFLEDARFIIDKVDEFELSLKLARQRDLQQNDDQRTQKEERH